MKTQPNKSLKALGNIIKSVREERGITQDVFAKRLKTTQSAVARIESGEQNVSASLLSRIGDILQKDIIEVGNRALSISIEGGRPLTGSIETKTSKNGAVGLLFASLINRGTTRLRRVPHIEEVNRIIEVLQSIGVSIKWSDHDLLITPPEKFSLDLINRSSAERTRSIIMAIGPLSRILPKFSLPHAGGCKLGRRTVRPHFYALENLGVHIRTTHNDYEITVGKPKQREIILYESGDTVTENTLLAAALTPGKTVIKYASANYQVQDVCFFLQKLGVSIEGIGTTQLTIEGVESIRMDAEYELSEDPIDSMFWLSAAIVTKSSITVTRCPIDFLELELLKLKKMGFRYSMGPRYKSRNGRTDLVDIVTKPSPLTALDEKIDARPYPGLNIDNLPFFAVIATAAKGQTFIHDWVYEERAIYYKELDKLGADVILADPHRVYITGPVNLKANEIICPPALRPAAIILIAMLGAKGTSILRNIYSINRGYEDIIKRLNSLGANVRILRNF